MRKQNYRKPDGYDIAGRWFIGIGLTVVLLLLLSLYLDGCSHFKYKVNREFEWGEPDTVSVVKEDTVYIQKQIEDK